MHFLKSICFSFWVVFILLLSCQDKQTEEQDKIVQTATTYLNEKIKDFDKSLKVDSIKVFKVDSISTKREFLFSIYVMEDSLSKLKEISQKKLAIANAAKSTYENLAQIGNLGRQASAVAGKKSYTPDDLTIFKNDAVEKLKDAGNSFKDAGFIAKQIDSLYKVYEMNKLDSTDFKFYNAKVFMCYSEKSLLQKCDTVYLKISKDFMVIGK